MSENEQGKEYVTLEADEEAIKQLEMAFDVADSASVEPTETTLTVRDPSLVYEYIANEDLAVVESITLEENWPKVGSLYFHNDSADSVEAHGDFDDLERGELAYQGLRNFMREVEIKVRLFRNGNVEVIEVNPDDGGGY